MNSLANTSASKDIQAICRRIYLETEVFYNTKVTQMGIAALGYAILYGPPILNPDTLFLGLQPGGSLTDAEAGLKNGERHRWPDKINYATETWRLAVVMRKIWRPSTLERCTGLNSIFFRAPTVKDWNNVPAPLRQELETFSRTRARLLIEAIAPKRIVVIGIGTFVLLADRSHEIVYQKGQKTLIRKGQIWGVPATGIIHLSGARIRREEMEILVKYFAADNSTTA